MFPITPESLWLLFQNRLANFTCLKPQGADLLVLSINKMSLAEIVQIEGIAHVVFYILEILPLCTE